MEKIGIATRDTKPASCRVSAFSDFEIVNLAQKAYVKGWKCSEIAAATSVKVPECIILIFSAGDRWQVAIVVDDCPGSMVHLNRFRRP